MENNFLKSVQKSHHISHHTKKSHHTPEKSHHKSHHTIRYPISNFKAKYNKQPSFKRSLATFDQFYEALDADSKVRGDQFEKLVKWFLQTDPRWKNQVKDIYIALDTDAIKDSLKMVELFFFHEYQFLLVYQ